MPEYPRFLFATCQIGAERALKEELARRWPAFRFAYSRPGFTTFKLPEEPRLRADFDLESVFARAYGFSLGKAVGATQDALARSVWDVFGRRPFRRIHVWERDARQVGDRGYEPSVTPAATEALLAICRHCGAPDTLAPEDLDRHQPARRGDFVLDCCLAGPGEWWVGYHRVRDVASQWPGGMMPLELPPDAVSRAWLKMEEALRWSQLPIGSGARCAEIGSAPGGASQALLARGATVLGIDPAAMHPAVLNHPNFTHVRRKVMAVRRREFRHVRWLMADVNQPPAYTLDAVEGIVTYPQVSIRGIILTLKLPRWDLAAEIPDYLGRVASWGFNVIRARQLQSNRQEVCVAALQRPFRRKPCLKREPG